MSDLFRARLRGSTREWPVGKVVCVGRNYAEHARELNNPVPEAPLLFMKPNSALVSLDEPVPARRGEEPIHYETEVAVLIGKPLAGARIEDTWSAVAGLGLALDLTLRGVQRGLKENGHPWECAKAFDGACPVSEFVPVVAGQEPGSLTFILNIDNEPMQRGQTQDMLTPIPELLAFISGHFSLQPGDIVLTGTPAGVGRLEPGMQLHLQASFGLDIHTSVL